MNIVVTGGAGFIGSHLSEKLLEKGHTVTIIDNLSTGNEENINSFRHKLRFVNADLSVKGDWQDELKEADLVFHLASLADIVPSIEKPDEYFQSNVVSTLNILESIRSHKNNTKIVYSASGSCYGIPNKYPTNEKSEIKPEYPYAMTKRIAEELVLHWGKVYGIKNVSLRFFNVYGTRSRTSGTYGAVFGTFLAQKLAGKPFTVVGDGNQTRDFTYVSDIVDGLILAGENDEITNQVINLGSGKPNSINHLVSLLGGEVVYIPKRPGEPDVTHADIEKAKQLLGYCPKVSFEEGVGKVLESIEYWKNAPVWSPETIEKATKAWFEYL